MAKHWLGLSILALWAATAVAAICGAFGVAWRLTEVGTALLILFVLRGVLRCLRWLAGHWQPR
jgi:hypothetical protein